MTVAALLDLGADKAVLKKALDSIPAGGFEIDITRVKKSGIDCCDFAVRLDAAHENHDHDMEYLHGHHHHAHTHDHEHEHEHHHDHEHTHEHHHDHGHTHEHHHHEHRGMAEIHEIISACDMTDSAKMLAEKIFGVLAEGEAKAHGVPADQVHFHEVGAVDSIADIIAAAVCFDSLGIDDVIIPRLCEGSGTVRCQHGLLPVPVPATANIASLYGLNLHMTGISGELVTPTGAAIAATLKTSDKLPDSFKTVKIGLGAGKREYEIPSILRAMLIEYENCGEDHIYKLESDIDDCSGEALGYTMERLLESGARDVTFMPVYMKKNRPACRINVICDEADISEMEKIIFENTTTIGVRRVKMERTVLPREIKTVLTEYGEVEVKLCGERTYPEYESVRKICREKNLPFGTVYNVAVNSYKE